MVVVVVAAAAAAEAVAAVVVVRKALAITELEILCTVDVLSTSLQSQIIASSLCL